MVGNDPTTKAVAGIRSLTPYVKKIRRIYASAFLGSHLKRMVPKLNSALDKMLEIIESHRKTGPIDLQRLCIRLTLDAIGIVAFETNLGGLDESSNLCQLVDKTGCIAFDRLMNPFKRLKRRLFPKSAEAQKDNAIIDALTVEWVRLTRDILSRDDPPDGETPLWFGLKQLADPSSAEPLEFKQLRAEVATAVIAGMDTTGHQLCWTLALLASYPGAMQTLLKEFKGRGLYGEAAKRVSYEDLGDMPYLTAVIKESMRIASIITSITREAPRDMTILGYRIPKGTYLFCPGNRWLDAKDEWGDPEVFRPERWLEEEDISQRYYFGFSYGPRDCAGQKLAMLEMRVALIRLLGAYHFSLTVPFDKLMDDSQNGIAIRVENGVWFHLTPRSQVATQ